MTFLTPTSGGSIRIPTSGNVYALARNTNVRRNGVQMAATNGTSLLTYTPNVVLRQIASTKTWQAWDGAAWRAAAAPVPARPTHSLSAPTQTGMTVTIADVPNADGYHVQWRDPKRGAAWTTA